MDSYGITGGDVTFIRDSNYALSTTASAGSDVVLMKGTIKTSQGAITFEDPEFDIDTLTIASNELSDLFSVIYLQIGSSIFSYVPVAADGAGDTITFNGSATVDGTVNVKLYGKLKNTASDNVEFSDLRLSSFTRAEYVSNGYTADTAVGSIAGIALTIEDTTLNVTRIDGIGDTTVAAGTSDMSVYKLKLTSSQGNGVKVNRAVFAIDNTNPGAGTDLHLNNTYLTLYVNGTPVSTKTVTAATVTFDGFNETINSTNNLELEIKATFAEAFDNGDFQVTLDSLNAYDALTSVAVTVYAEPAGAVLTIGTAEATLATSNEAPKATLLLSPSVDNSIAAFKLTATNDSVRLYDLKVTLPDADAANLSNFRVANASGTIATATSIASAAGTTTVLFSNISNAPSIARDTSATYYVLANVNSNISAGDVTATIVKVGTNVKSSNGTVVPVDGAGNLVANTHAIAENTMVVAKAATNPSKAIASSALRFTVTASGKDSISLTAITTAVSQFGYVVGAAALDDGDMVLYRDSVSTLNEVTLGGANSTVDAGSTVTFIVAYPGAVMNDA